MCEHAKPADPRKTHIDGSFSCVKCGRLVDDAGLRPRDEALERQLTRLAARSVGCEAAASSLRAFADARAWPGGVRPGLDPTQECAEELGDASNYLLWGVERIYPSMVAGDPGACDEYERLMRALGAVVLAWRELNTPSA